MKRRILLLTGSPGVGKTSVLLRIVESLQAAKYSVGGMISREIRVEGVRVGFQVLDLKTDRKGWLAHVTEKQGPHVGRYTVNLEDLDGIGVEAISNALTDSDVIVIDEIGPMELCSLKFKEIVAKAIESSKLVVGVVHWKVEDSLIAEAKGRSDAEVHVVTIENRGQLDELVFKEALNFLQG